MPRKKDVFIVGFYLMFSMLNFLYFQALYKYIANYFKNS